MSATDVKPASFIENSAIDVRPPQTRRTDARDVNPPTVSNQSGASDQFPSSRGAFEGNPRSPEGAGSGFNKGSLIASEDYLISATPASGAIDFNGSQGLSITDALQTGLDLSGDFTIEMWLNPTTLPSTNTKFALVSKLSSSGGYEVSIFRDAGGAINIRVIVRQDGSTIDTATKLFSLIQMQTPSVPFHLAITNTMSTQILTFIVNGVEKSTSGYGNSSSIGNNTADFAVSMAPDGTSKYNGVLKEVRVWSVVRTTSQIITDLRNNNPSGSGLQGYWPLNSDTNDYSGNGNHLTRTGSPSIGSNPFFTNYGKTTRFYSTAGDGDVTNTGAGGWAGVRSASTGSTADSTGATTTAVVSKPGFSGSRTIRRMFLPIDTTSFNGRAIDAFLHPFVSVESNSFDRDICLIQTTQADTSTLTTADFDQCGDLNSPIEGMTRIPLSTFDAVNSNDFPLFLQLNSNGLGFIQQGGITKLGIRISSDIDNQEPTGTSAASDLITLATSEAANTTVPFLDIVTLF